jgi:hypothetical protein
VDLGRVARRLTLDQARFQNCRRISKVDSPATAPAPASSSEQNNIMYRMDSQVLFGQLTPNAAAAAWIEQMKATKTQACDSTKKSGAAAEGVAAPGVM